LQRIGELQSELRKAHLAAHLAQAALLDDSQTARYVELRGYARPQGHSSQEHH
jgi:hypothetical protein